MAKFPYMTILDGVWYPAGAEVPVGEPTSEKVDAIKEEANDTEQEPVQEKAFRYTRKELQNMKSDEVRKVATEYGYHDLDGISANEIRRNLMIQFKL